MAELAPTGARFVDPRIFEIAWSDGRVLHYAPEEVRAACPCAHCVTDRTARPDALRRPGVRLKRLSEVGRYAFQLVFSDGHELGIYPYEQLARLGHPPGKVPAWLPPEGGFDV